MFEKKNLTLCDIEIKYKKHTKTIIQGSTQCHRQTVADIRFIIIENYMYNTFFGTHSSKNNFYDYILSRICSAQYFLSRTYEEPALCVHSVFTQCLFCVHSVFILCSLWVKPMFILFSLNVHSVFTLRSLCVRSMFILCSLCVHSVLILFSRNVHFVLLSVFNLCSFCFYSMFILS